MRAIFLTLLLTGCYPEMPEDKAQDNPAGSTGMQTTGMPGKDGRDAVVAGTRLRPLYWKGNDGTRAPSLWFRDSQTGARCALQMLSGDFGAEGTIYLCTPGGRPVVPGDEGRMVRFTLDQ